MHNFITFLKQIIFVSRAETETDYGTLSCLGYNRIGSQIRPCSFTINPASKFYVVIGCQGPGVVFTTPYFLCNL
jgi:hypothetical protein